MKVYTLVYNEFAHFEVILANLILREPGVTVTVGIDSEPVLSEEGYRILPDTTVGEVDVEDVDVFLVPGGDPKVLEGCLPLFGLLKKLGEAGKVIGAICAGPVHLSRAGILSGRKYTTSVDVSAYSELDSSNFINQNVVVDGSIITAKGAGYVDFGLELGKMMNIYKDEDDYKLYVDFFRNFKG